MLASRFVTNSVFCLFAFTTYVLVVVVLFTAAIAFVSIAPSLVAVAVVVAAAPGYLVSFFIAYCRRRRLPGRGPKGRATRRAVARKAAAAAATGNEELTR